jgi:hypothetical protein
MHERAKSIGGSIGVHNVNKTCAARAGESGVEGPRARHYLTHFGEHFSTESEDSGRLIEGLLHDLALASIFRHHVDVGAAEHNRVRHLRAEQYLASAECMHTQHSRAALL